MEKRIYFTDKALLLTDMPSSLPDRYTMSASEFSRAKILKIFETFNTIEVVADSVEQLFDQILAEFKFVEAAGGLVENELGECLMMYRRGRWDLPKGHVEPYESLDVCALREVEEETGLANLEILGFLCNTYHAYSVYGAWELKQTSWYAMRGRSDALLTPQTEEGIERVYWCSEAEVAENKQHTFPTIQEVFEKKSKING